MPPCLLPRSSIFHWHFLLLPSYCFSFLVSSLSCPSAISRTFHRIFIRCCVCFFICYRISNSVAVLRQWGAISASSSLTSRFTVSFDCLRACAVSALRLLHRRFFLRPLSSLIFSTLSSFGNFVPNGTSFGSSSYSSSYSSPLSLRCTTCPLSRQTSPFPMNVMIRRRFVALSDARPPFPSPILYVFVTSQIDSLRWKSSGMLPVAVTFGTMGSECV